MGTTYTYNTYTGQIIVDSISNIFTPIIIQENPQKFNDLETNIKKYYD